MPLEFSLLAPWAPPGTQTETAKRAGDEAVPRYPRALQENRRSDMNAIQRERLSVACCIIEQEGDAITDATENFI